jgi:hypothetical protein
VALSVIVVTYGARDATLRCLGSIARAAEEPAHEIVIVDNGSPDGLAEEIASRFPRFRIAPQAQNLGFAAASNIGANLAHGAYLLFLNPDTIVPEDAFVGMLAFAHRRPAAGIWGGRTIFADGTTNPTSSRRRTTLWTLFCNGLALDTRFRNLALIGSADRPWRQHDKERSVDVVCGCFLLVERRLWDRLGGFSPAYFMYGEDEDLSLRARKLGFCPAFTFDSAVIHFGSGTESDKARKIKQVLSARALYIRMHFSPLTRWLALALLNLRPGFGRLLASPDLRELWRDVWTCRRQWISGRFGGS